MQTATQDVCKYNLVPKQSMQYRSNFLLNILKIRSTTEAVVNPLTDRKAELMSSMSSRVNNIHLAVFRNLLGKVILVPCCMHVHTEK